MPQLLRTNPGLLVWLVIFGVCALVCTLVGMLMSRQGASLRSIYWFAGFMLLIGGPQFMAHLYFAFSALKKESPRIDAMKNLANDSSRETRQESVKLLFGEDADADLVIDARSVFGEALAKADVARFASLPSGESVLLARFNGYSDAERGWFLYLQHTGLNTLGGKGDSQRGYAVTRPAGDRAYALHVSNMLGVWTGLDDSAIRRRMIAGGFTIPARAPLEKVDEAVLPDDQKAHQRVAAENKGQSQVTSGAAAYKRKNTFALALGAGGLAAYLFLVVMYFFKGVAWAGGSPARGDVAPISGVELATRLQSINHRDVPFRIERGERDNELIATWRYADAKWIDLARTHGMRRVHRIKLALDESSHIVRATDFTAGYDWSAGRDGANIEWKATSGITFFHYEHRRVFGLQWDEQGHFKPELSSAYTFNLQEMKRPLIEGVTRAGWNWRPVIWQGPKWLRWLTE